MHYGIKVAYYGDVKPAEFFKNFTDLDQKRFFAVNLDDFLYGSRNTVRERVVAYILSEICDRAVGDIYKGNGIYPDAFSGDPDVDYGSDYDLTDDEWADLVEQCPWMEQPAVE